MTLLALRQVDAFYGAAHVLHGVSLEVRAGERVAVDAVYVATVNKADDISGKSCTARSFRANRPDASDAAVVRPWLATRPEKRWAIHVNDMAWGRNSGASFSRTAQATGHSVVVENYAPFGTNDCAPYIQKILDSGAEGLWVALAGRDAINFATQARQFGLFNKVFTAGVSFVTDNTVKTLGDVLAGVWGIINYSATLDLPANQAFVRNWAARYPTRQPSDFEGETYIGMQVIFHAVQKAGSVKAADLARDGRH